MNRGVQISDSVASEWLSQLDWDDIRIFLAVAPAGSFKAAALALNVAPNTVRSHIKRLEDITGVALFERNPKGVRLTGAGSRLAEVAKEMAAASRGIGKARTQPAGLSSAIHLSVTEGIGTFWMVPRLADFRQGNRETQINLECTMAPTMRFADSNTIAVQLVRPEDPDAVCVRLGTLHLMPFASPEYIRENGVPRSMAEVRDHHLVIQTGEQMKDEILPVLFGEQPPPGLFALETNSSAAHFWAIAKGIGIGMLPTYARAITRSVVPIDLDLAFRRDIWLSYPMAARDSKSVSEAIAWIRESFDPRLYPWFADTFVHPDTFEAEFEGTNVVRLFAGFVDIPAQIT